MLNVTDHGPVREIRLERPPVNALNPALVDTLQAALEAAGGEADGVVLSGREGLFSAGLDVPALLVLDRSQMGAFWRSFEALLKTIACMPVPTAVAITGHSPAGGAVMSLFADYRVMSRGPFKIGLNETQVGLTLPGFIHDALVRLVGAHRAERLIVAGALVSPEHALSLGLVDDLADSADAAVEAAVEWCRSLMKLPRKTMLTNRGVMRHSLTRLFDQPNDEEEFLAVWFSEETQATLKALVASLGKK
ncbi:enoyl-CoA hydratase/isomerase family protein [Marinihelvus fidelis]|uniref:Enoyl-CoA hydratase/isomerase family protein n=1 Tax=Marinihelvus fidelis TaxID=2613842 RepID=A0A5N0TBU8_9GAMM|nr:enoyl-CoA hydratase/isomerase family protein [Marinihelvus fidelis]KAA9132553.1 enoyl-CoA hydratase/isomerase family protein [Marinihelvus fidelis]